LNKFPIKGEILLTEKLDIAGKDTEIQMNKFDSIIDSIQAGIVIIDEETHQIIDINRKAMEMIGSGKNDIIGKICHEFICPAKYGECPITDLGQTVDNSEKVLITWKGEAIPILKTVTLADIGGSRYLIESFLDLTDQKKQDEKIRTNENNLRDLFDNASDLIQQVDENGNIIRVNRAWCKTLGYSEEEALELNLRDIVHPEHYNPYMKKFRAIQSGNNYPEIETTFMKKDGSNIEVMGSINGRFENERFSYSRGIFHDITNRKAAESALRKSESELRAITDSAQDAIIKIDGSGKVCFWNPGAERIFGYTKEEILEKNLHDLLAPKRYHERLNKGFAEFIKTGQGAAIGQTLEMAAIHKNGHEVPIELNLSSLHNYGEWYAIAIVRDITERKKTDDALKEEKNRVKKYLEIAGVMMVAIDARGNVTLANKKACEILGYDENEIIGKNWFDNFIPERSVEFVRPISERLLQGETESTEFYENPVLTRDGKEKLIAWHNSILRNMDGDIIGHLSSGEDITQRKQAEKNLLENEKKYRTLFDLSQDAIMTFAPPSWQFTSANKATIKLFKAKDEAEFITKGPWDVSPEYQNNGENSSEKARSMIEKAMKDGANLFEWTHMKLNGEVAPATVLLSRIELDGKLQLQATVRDITRQKEAPEAMKRSEEKYRLITESSSDLISTLDLDGNYIYISPSHGLLGYTEEELIGKPGFDYVHPDDAEYLMSIFLEKLKDPKSDDSISLEYRLRDSKGNWHNLETTANFVFDDREEPESILLISKDVTDRRKMETELRESEERYHDLITQSIDGIILIDIDGIVLEWNPGMERISGIPGSQAVGKGIWEAISRLLPPGTKGRDAMEDMKESMQRSMIDPEDENWGKLMNFKFYNTEIGEFVDVQAMNFPINTERGVMAASMMRDVTELRKMEHTMTRIMKQLEKLKVKPVTLF